MELDFDKLYKYPTLALNVSRSHPYIKRDKKWLLQFSTVHGMFTSVFILVVYNILYHDLKINNFSQTCKNGVLCVVYIVITFQYSVLLWHQNSLLDMIRNVKRDYELSKNLNIEDRNVVFKYVNQSKWVCKQWFIISITGFSVFVIKNIVIMIYYYAIHDFRLVPFYELVFPTIIEGNKENIFVYLGTYVCMMFYAFYGALMYAAFVPLGPIFILHACAQLELVERQINNLFSDDCQAQAIRDKLKVIVKQLQYTYGFVDHIQKVFREVYEVTLKGTTIMLPITCYEVIEASSHGEVSLEFLTFIFGGVLISSSPCYYSDLLMEKGENVRLCLYTCGWELIYDRRTRTTLQLMLQRALRPITIRTVFRSLCLEALTDVFQQSYAIFNLINAMWN